MTLKRGDHGFSKAIRTKLYVAVVSDVLDYLGHTDQAMSSHIRPLDDSLVLAGYARTGLYQDIFTSPRGESVSSRLPSSMTCIPTMCQSSRVAPLDESHHGASFFRPRPVREAPPVA